jgi:hypothetical protein
MFPPFRQDAGMASEQRVPTKKGCFFYGCLTAVVLGVFGVILLYFTYHFFKRSADRLIIEYTTNAPVKIPRVELPPGPYRDLTNRLYAFGQALEKQDASRELVLTAEEINGLINQDPDLKSFRDAVFVHIVSNKISGDISMPLSDIGPFKLSGRYLNGVASFQVALTNNQLDVRIDNVQVNGKPLPGVFMSKLKGENLAEKFESDPKTRELLDKLDTIRIEDGKLYLRNKAGGGRGP